MYDGGEDNSKTKMMENYKKQLAFIQYVQTEDKPRKMEALITTCDNLSTDFTIMDNNANVIGSKWNADSKRNLCKLSNRDPSFDPKDCNFKLDFGGLAGVPSIKNFIL